MTDFDVIRADAMDSQMRSSIGEKPALAGASASQVWIAEGPSVPPYVFVVDHDCPRELEAIAGRMAVCGYDAARRVSSGGVSVQSAGVAKEMGPGGPIKFHGEKPLWGGNEEAPRVTTQDVSAFTSAWLVETADDIMVVVMPHPDAASAADVEQEARSAMEAQIRSELQGPCSMRPILSGRFAAMRSWGTRNTMDLSVDPAEIGECSPLAAIDRSAKP